MVSITKHKHLSRWPMLSWPSPHLSEGYVAPSLFFNYIGGYMPTCPLFFSTQRSFLSLSLSLSVKTASIAYLPV